MKDDIGFILPLYRQLSNLPFSYADKRELVRVRAAERKERAEMVAAGYRKHETDWEIHRGALQTHVIVDAKISFDGKYVWTKLG